MTDRDKPEFRGYYPDKLCPKCGYLESQHHPVSNICPKSEKQAKEWYALLWEMAKGKL